MAYVKAQPSLVGMRCVFELSGCNSTLYIFAAFAPFFGFGDSIPETALEGVVNDEENGADTGIIAATGDSTANSSCRGQRLDEEEKLCFVRAILHLPDEESRPSVSGIFFSASHLGVLFIHKI